MPNAPRRLSSSGTSPDPQREKLPVFVRKTLAWLPRGNRRQLTGIAAALTVEAERRAVAS